MFPALRVRSMAMLALPVAVVGVIAAFAFASAASDVEQTAEVESSVQTAGTTFAALDALQAERAVLDGGIGVAPSPAATDDVVAGAIAANPELASLTDQLVDARESGDRADYSVAIARILDLPVADATAADGSIDRDMFATHRLANLEEAYLSLAASLTAAEVEEVAALQQRIDVLIDDYRSTSATAQRFSIDSALAGAGDDTLGVAGALAAATEIAALRTETLAAAQTAAAARLSDAVSRRTLLAVLGPVGVLLMLALALVAHRSLMGPRPHTDNQGTGVTEAVLTALVGRTTGDAEKLPPIVTTPVPMELASVVSTGTPDRVVASRLDPLPDDEDLFAVFTPMSEARPSATRAAMEPSSPATGASSDYVSREAAVRLGLDPRSMRAKLAELREDDAPALDTQPTPSGLPAV